MTNATFAEYKAAAHREGYDEVVERIWPAGTVVAQHEHAFSVKALVVAGEMWLTDGGTTRHLRLGEVFELAAATPHAERYGDAGATIWAARRKPR